MGSHLSLFHNFAANTLSNILNFCHSARTPWSMALICQPSSALTNKPPISSYRSSDVRITKLRAKKHENYRTHKNQTGSNIVMRQKIHVLDSKKFPDDDIHIRHAKALKEVNQVLINKVRESEVEGLFMIDNIQRLGIEYYFEEEIQAALEKQHLMFSTQSYRSNGYDLELVALQFRLLRQQGYYVHQDVFDSFKDNKGSLKHQFYRNIKGLIGLFEASQLSIVGEDDLDKAGDFSRQLLNAWLLKFQNHRNAKIVANRLQYPIQRSLPRFTPRCLQSQSSLVTRGWTGALEELSQLDTHLVNSIHLEEIFAVSKWWKDLGLSKDLKFVRDEPIKWYMWAMACITDPSLSEERIEITKPLSLVYIIDDIFDAYGSMDELILFNDAIRRWDLAALQQLPDYMRPCFKALYDITNEFANKVQKRHGWNPIDSLIKSWMRLCDAFMEEAKWFSTGQLPAAPEYLKNGLVSTGMHMVFVHIFFLLGQGITKEAVALLDDFPALIASTSTILRLCDDLEGDKDDSNDENDGSYMECYMKDNPGISLEEAREKVTKTILSAWKSLNQEIMNPSTPFPLSFRRICYNGARMVPLMYGDEESKHSRSRLEDHIKSLLYDSRTIGIPQDLPK